MALRPYIVGNWKMNGLRGALAEARAIDRWRSVTLLSRSLWRRPRRCSRHGSGGVAFGVGAQNATATAAGLYREVSAAMLADAGAHFAIVGHSERRWQQGEDDSLVRAKAEAVLAAGMQALVCVGENEDKRLAGQAEATVIEQLQGSLLGSRARRSSLWSVTSRSGPSARAAFPR
jgi:triosephosphate isomerase